MKLYTEPSREIPVEGEFDIIVAGSGPAGASAVKHGTGLREVDVREIQSALTNG